jgi:CubicO group peptidase (beta-lactamase class C family)
VTCADVDVATVDDVVRRLLAHTPELGVTLAVLAVHRGEVVAEGYGPDTDETTPLISWSMAKSITHAAVGVLVRDGRLELDVPAPVPAWAGTEKAAITTQQLLEMRPGLRFVEDYVDAEISHCIDMLFGAGTADHAAYAAALPLDHPPGTVWNYSSGTTNIVARIVGDVVGGGEAGMRAFLTAEVFEPAGMTSADPRFDAAGTFVGSSYVYATARDFARFGELYLHDGVAPGHDGVAPGHDGMAPGHDGAGDRRRILPVGWVDHARRPTPGVPDSEPFGYGAHWWLWRDEPGSLGAHGYEGQYTVVVPSRELVVVRLGKTPAELRPNLVAELRRLVRAFPTV